MPACVRVGEHACAFCPHVLPIQSLRTVYRHTNLVARDWRRLSAFYEQVFGCTPVPPPRRHSGDWLARGTAVESAAMEGQHLRLPGHGDGGPTLEIYTYATMLDAPPPAANRCGYGHLAFEVDDVPATLAAVVSAGGAPHGGVVVHDVTGVGRLTFVYARDPEGNLLELQRWEVAGDRA